MGKVMEFFGLLGLAGGLMGVAAGEVAPEFTAQNQKGETKKLSDFKGQPVLIYFYPKDDTPGCTKEACTFRDEYAKFKKVGAVILGVSAQDERSHKAFADKFHLPFDLLVDKDGKIGEKFGVSRMPLIGLHKRQSVLIGKDGKIVKFYDTVDPGKHAAEVLAELEKQKT